MGREDREKIDSCCKNRNIRHESWIGVTHSFVHARDTTLVLCRLFAAFFFSYTIFDLCKFAVFELPTLLGSNFLGSNFIRTVRERSEFFIFGRVSYCIHYSIDPIFVFFLIRFGFNECLATSYVHFRCILLLMEHLISYIMNQRKNVRAGFLWTIVKSKMCVHLRKNSVEKRMQSIRLNANITSVNSDCWTVQKCSMKRIMISYCIDTNTQTNLHAQAHIHINFRSLQSSNYFQFDARFYSSVTSVLFLKDFYTRLGGSGYESKNKTKQMKSKEKKFII